MIKKHVISFQLLPAFLLLALLPNAVRSQDTLESNPGPTNYGNIPLSSTMEPTRTSFGTVGMSNVISAEPLGAGRLGMQLRGNLYPQSKAQPGTPGKDAQITTLTFGAALGLNPYIDGFVSATAYNIRGGGVSGSGAGSTALGAQATMPLPEDYPFRLGLQVASIFGTAGSQINTTLRPSGEAGANGYNYLETRKFTDLMAKFVQSFIFAGDNMGVKFHLNEGVLSSFEPGKGILLVTGAGVQFIVMPPLVLGLEINDRTFLSKISGSDPLWITPSVVFRTPAHMNVLAGADISLASDQSNGTRTLEPWRGFVAITVSYDTQREMRRQQAEAAHRTAMEKAMLARKADEAIITRDSLAAANALAQADQKETAEALAIKAREDSISLATSQSNLSDTRLALAEERSKRTDAEKQLLGTGMLLLDAVYFQSGKTDISINSKPYLNIIARMLAKYPKLEIEVSGHTDNVGGEAYNMGLSQGRAGAVRTYMARMAPDLNGHLTSKGYGLTQPKADNNTEDGKKYNRRIELRVLNRDALAEYNP